MSITQTYYLAHKARAKLSREAAQPDHNLRLLVGHANLLDSLMIDLAEAEREQESWFNQSVRSASPKNEERHIQWADSVPDRTEEDWEADSSDSESDSDSDFDEDEDVEMADAVFLKRIPSTSTTTTAVPQSQPTLGENEALGEIEDDEEDYAALTLTRSQSHSTTPPELDLDSDSSEDDSMPPSPPFASLPTFTQNRRENKGTETYDDSKETEDDDDKSDFYNDGYYLPPRNPARLVSAISVY